MQVESPAFNCVCVHHVSSSCQVSSSCHISSSCNVSFYCNSKFLWGLQLNKEFPLIFPPTKLYLYHYGESGTDNLVKESLFVPSIVSICMHGTIYPLMYLYM